MSNSRAGVCTTESPTAWCAARCQNRAIPCRARIIAIEFPSKYKTNGGTNAPMNKMAADLEAELKVDLERAKLSIAVAECRLLRLTEPEKHRKDAIVHNENVRLGRKDCGCWDCVYEGLPSFTPTTLHDPDEAFKYCFDKHTATIRSIESRLEALTGDLTEAALVKKLKHEVDVAQCRLDRRVFAARARDDAVRHNECVRDKQVCCCAHCLDLTCDGGVTVPTAEHDPKAEFARVWGQYTEFLEPK